MAGIKGAYSLAFLNSSFNPIIYNVSSESTRVAPRPPKVLTPFFDCGWTIEEYKKEKKKEN
jgi:hypothetical protein